MVMEWETSEKYLVQDSGPCSTLWLLLSTADVENLGGCAASVSKPHHNFYILDQTFPRNITNCFFLVTVKFRNKKCAIFRAPVYRIMIIVHLTINKSEQKELEGPAKTHRLGWIDLNPPLRISANFWPPKHFFEEGYWTDQCNHYTGWAMWDRV